MANPAPGVLPALLDPLLEYLSSILPPPLYSLLVKLVSHSLAAIFALLKLSNSCLTNAPEDWNVQTILPPLITIFTAYLAISSFYRTTSWLLRISFWFMKWGTLFGVFIGGLGYLLGNAGGDALANQGGIPDVGGLLWSLLEDPRSTKVARSTNSRNKKSNTKRPKPWESFDRHKDWQYQEGRDGKGNKDAQQIISQIVDAAGNMFGGSWLGALKSVVGDTGGKSNDDDSTTYSKSSPKSKAKGKTARTR